MKQKNKKKKQRQSLPCASGEAQLTLAWPSPPPNRCHLLPRRDKLLGGGRAWPRRHLDAERLPAPPGPHLPPWEGASQPPFLSPPSRLSSPPPFVVLFVARSPRRSAPPQPRGHWPSLTEPTCLDTSPLSSSSPQAWNRAE